MSIYLHKSLNFKLRYILCNPCKNVKCLTIEISTEKKKTSYLVLISVINKLIRVMEKSTSMMDHTLNDEFVNQTVKTAILECDVSDYCPIFLFFNVKQLKQKPVPVM